jgi:tetratricopeptide (TPR) repeat protein
MLLRTEIERIEPATAAKSLRAYVAGDPGDHHARHALARAEETLGNTEEATRLIQQCLAEHPAEASTWRDWLRMLHNRGDTQGLEAAIATLPPAADQDAEIWQYRAIVKDRAGDLPAAGAALRQAVALDPYNADYRYRLSLIEQRLGNREAGRAEYARSRELREARNALKDVASEYRNHIAQRRTAESTFPALVTRLVGICRGVGLDRLAQELEREHPTPPALSHAG